MLRGYLQGLYQRAMREAYGKATQEIVYALRDGGDVLDCGANSGWMYRVICEHMPLSKSDYFGVDWDETSVAEALRSIMEISRNETASRLEAGSMRIQ